MRHSNLWILSIISVKNFHKLISITLKLIETSQILMDYYHIMEKSNDQKSCCQKKYFLLMNLSSRHRSDDNFPFPLCERMETVNVMFLRKALSNNTWQTRLSRNSDWDGLHFFKGYVRRSQAVSLAKKRLAPWAKRASISGPVLFWLLSTNSRRIWARTVLDPLSHSLSNESMLLVAVEADAILSSTCSRCWWRACTHNGLNSSGTTCKQK